MGIVEWFREKLATRRSAVIFERQVVVAIDEVGISATYPGGEIQKVQWSEVDCVAIETNDTGPWGADFWWLLEGKNGRCTYPQGATGEMEALRILPGKFQGFNDEQVIRANGCTSNARFVCWERVSAL